MPRIYDHKSGKILRERRVSLWGNKPPRGDLETLARRAAKERAAGFNRRDLLPGSTSPGGVVSSSGIISAHEKQAGINRGLEGRRMFIGVHPQTALEDLRDTWTRPMRGGGIGWSRLAKREYRGRKEIPLPRDKVVGGIALAFEAKTPAFIEHEDLTIREIAEYARRKLWRNGVRRNLTKQQLTRETVAQLEYTGYKLATPKKK